LGFKGRIFFVPHHYSHASVAYYSSAFSKAGILTVDGVGEYQTTGLWYAVDKKIKPLKLINFPNSLGLLYSTFTSFLGFKINEDEYKVMGLAAYGKPTYVKEIYTIINVKNDGSFHFNMDFFAFREGFQMWNKNFEKLLGKPRLPSETIQKRHKDLAASIQKVTEEIYFKILNYLCRLIRTDNLCISGGVALNALANGKIYQKTPFKKVYIFGAAGDSGGALGAALFTYYSILIYQKTVFNKDSLYRRASLNNLYLGSSYENNQIKSVLKRFKLRYKKFEEEEELIEKTASLLTKNKIIGWFQGRMEFGPRALGSRSILANPKPHFMKDKVNEIKRREQFRPFAGSILQEEVHEYFEVPKKNHWSPFMTFCFPVKKEKEKELTAIIHYDGTCRIQTVSKENGRYYKLIKRFHEITGIPCILNTSFNLKGEPIVENPEQAIEDFLKINNPEQFDFAHCKLRRRTKMDYLVIGDFLVSKT
jgi:carbamoyltransferase